MSIHVISNNQMLPLFNRMWAALNQQNKMYTRPPILVVVLSATKYQIGP